MEKGRTYNGHLVPEALLPEPTVMGFGTGELIEEGERGSTPPDVPLGSLYPTLPGFDSFIGIKAKSMTFRTLYISLHHHVHHQV